MKRRSFLKYMSIGATTALGAPSNTAAQIRKQGSKQTSPPKRYKEWITARIARLISKDHIAAFLNCAPNNQWAQFDPELGYVLKDSIQQDGMDGSQCIYRFNPGGERRTINFVDRACRINTYGNSFTQCHQVSDGETWQEYLAAHLRVNLDNGEFEEAPNPCPTPELLYKLASPDYVYETFGSHPVVQLTAMRDGVSDVEPRTIRKLADWAGYRFDFSDGESRASSAKMLYDIVAYKSTLYLLERFKRFVVGNQRNLLVLLTHGGGKVARFISGEPKNKYDISVIRCLQEHNVPYVDSLDKHKDDFEQFRITPWEYVNRYYIGHYNPMGNNFLAYAIKDAVVAWLDPKPTTYREEGSIINFTDD